MKKRKMLIPARADPARRALSIRVLHEAAVMRLLRPAFVQQGTASEIGSLWMLSRMF